MDEMQTPPPPAPPGPSSALTHAMGPGFGNVLGDMRFVGWVGLVYGILTCLSIAGAIIGVMPLAWSASHTAMNSVLLLGAVSLLSAKTLL